MIIAVADLPNNLRLIYDGELLILNRYYNRGDLNDINGGNREILSQMSGNTEERNDDTELSYQFINVSEVVGQTPK